MEDISLISFLRAGHGDAPSVASLPAQGDPSHCPTTPSSLKYPGITTVCKYACAHTCACPCVHVCALWSPGGLESLHRRRRCHTLAAPAANSARHIRPCFLKTFPATARV